MTQTAKKVKLEGVITKDGSSGIKAESGRFHLYVGLGCPWCTRCLSVISLKGLDKHFTYTVLDWHMGKEGWAFVQEDGVIPECHPDPVWGKKLLKEIYMTSDPNYSGKITAPVLFDKKTKKIVSNDSAMIMKMLNSEFDAFCEGEKMVDLYPARSSQEIDELSNWIESSICDGAYDVGGAKTQEEYEKELQSLFQSLDRAEKILSQKRFLTGELSLADLRLFSTMIRFEAVYSTHFKANMKPLSSYPHLTGYIRELYQMPQIKKHTNFQHIKAFYFSNTKVNPGGVIPMGPDLSHLETEHKREGIQSNL